MPQNISLLHRDDLPVVPDTFIRAKRDCGVEIKDHLQVKVTSTNSGGRDFDDDIVRLSNCGDGGINHANVFLPKPCEGPHLSAGGVVFIFSVNFGAQGAEILQVMSDELVERRGFRHTL